MNLLIITQKIDITDPLLGFFHQWIIEFSKYSDITIICLQKGSFNFPKNVRVFSLGKENAPKLLGLERLIYLINFYKLILYNIFKYDKVFIHMNQIYVILGSILWKIFKKKIFLWRNHPSGNMATKIAILLSTTVFCTSPQSFTAKYKKTCIMPAGINTDLFKRNINIEKINNSILSLGRISPIKRIDQLIRASAALEKNHIKCTINIIGSPLPKDNEYFQELKKDTDLMQVSKINWVKACKNFETVFYYNENCLFINLTPSGSLDKTILEAMACETMIITSNKYFENILDSRFYIDDVSLIADKITNIFKIKPEEVENIGKRLRQHVIDNHSLKKLAFNLNIKMK